jgi:hypothetical protein
MEEIYQAFIKDSILPNFLDVDKTLEFGEYKYIFPDRNALFFELNDSKYVLFFADHISNDLDLVSSELKKIGVTVKRYIPTKKDQDSYAYFVNRNNATYQGVFDDCFVCGRL